MTIKAVQPERFEPLRAATDPTYLFAHVDESRAFADGALDIQHVEVIQAIKIKGVLKEKVDTKLLRDALAMPGAPRDEVLFYLSKVGVPELEEDVVVLINEELRKDGEIDTSVYWMIKALQMMSTKSSQLYVRGLAKHPKVTADPVAAGAISPQFEIPSRG